MQSLRLNRWAESIKDCISLMRENIAFSIQPICRCFCKYWSISIKDRRRFDVATILILNGEVNTTALIEGRRREVGVGLGSFNGRPTTVCWNNNYEDYLFLIDMPFLTMKRTIIPRTARLSHAQYAIEIKRVLCKISKNSHISAKTLFLCQRLYQRTIILALKPLNSPV